MSTINTTQDGVTLPPSPPSTLICQTTPFTLWLSRDALPTMNMDVSQGGTPEMQEDNRKKEIYTYQAPWLIYAMNWSIRPDHKFRLAMGSFLEDYTNKGIQHLFFNSILVHFSLQRAFFFLKQRFSHPPPPQKKNQFLSLGRTIEWRKRWICANGWIQAPLSCHEGHVGARQSGQLVRPHRHHRRLPAPVASGRKRRCTAKMLTQ